MKQRLIVEMLRNFSRAITHKPDIAGVAMFYSCINVWLCVHDLAESIERSSRQIWFLLIVWELPTRSPPGTNDAFSTTARVG